MGNRFSYQDKLWVPDRGGGRNRNGLLAGTRNDVVLHDSRRSDAEMDRIYKVTQPRYMAHFRKG